MRAPTTPNYFLLAATISTLVACSSAPTVPDGAQAVVVSVVDGDTLDATFAIGRHRVEERIRLIGIDTPETKKPDAPVECFGAEATERLSELLPPGTPIVVERDAETRDVYGRLLAHVRRLDDGTLVNLVMLAEGFATTLVIAPNRANIDLYAAAEREARDLGRGLWASCTGGHQPLTGSVAP